MYTEHDAPSFSLVADQLIILSTKWRKEITDILSSIQAFLVFTLVGTAYYPARVSDLPKYSTNYLSFAQPNNSRSLLGFLTIGRFVSKWQGTNSMTARICIPNYFIFTSQAASRSNDPQSLPPSAQSLRKSRLGTLQPLRSRVLHQRPLFVTRCCSSFPATFLVALHRIDARWHIRKKNANSPASQLLFKRRRYSNV